MTLRPDDLPPDTTPSERVGLEQLAERLVDERPYPSAAFRSRLRAAIGTSPPARGLLAALRPAYGAAGSTLLLVAGLGVAGVGPFAA